MNISFIVKQLINNQEFNLHFKQICKQQHLKSTLTGITQPKQTFHFNIQKQEDLSDIESTDQHTDKQQNQKRFSISSSNCLKRNSRQSLSSMSATNYFKFKNNSEDVTINQLVNQISDSLMQLKKNQVGESHLQQELNQFQITKKLEQMQIQFEKQYMKKFNSEKQQLKKELEAIVIQTVKKLKKERISKKQNNKTKILKKQRKNVAQSILDITRNNRQFNVFRQVQDPSNFCSDSDSFNDSEELQKSVLRNSQQLSSISSKLQKVQKVNDNKIKQMWVKFKQEQQQNTRDIQSINDRIIQWKLRNEQKIQNGFSGIWNIITQKEDQVSKLNSRVQLIEQYIGIKDN